MPKHAQVSEMLIREIAAGRLADGSRLPPERVMAESLGIAVGTLRKSLQTLEKKGVLNRIQGSGNYVQARPGVASIYSMLRLEKLSGGGLPTAEILNVERTAKPPEAPYFGPSDAAWRFRRIRFLSDTPAALEEIWLDASLAEKVQPNDVSESLYLYYQERLGLVILSCEDHVSVAPLPDWHDARFPMAPGAVAGFVERIARDAGGEPVEYSRTWFDPANVRYTNRIGRG